jgi:hypothetical protein
MLSQLAFNQPITTALNISTGCKYKNNKIPIEEIELLKNA